MGVTDVRGESGDVGRGVRVGDRERAEELFETRGERRGKCPG